MTFSMLPPDSRRTFSTFTLAVLSFISSVTPLAAQDSLRLAPGTRVRVWVPTVSKHKQVAEIVAFRDDTLFLRMHDGGWLLPLANVRGLDVSRGRRSAGARLARGAGFGLLIGGGFGVLLGMRGSDKYSGGEGALMLGRFFGTVGAVVGGLIGAVSPGERWLRVPLPSRVSVMPRWSPKEGLRLASSVAF